MVNNVTNKVWSFIARKLKLCPVLSNFEFYSFNHDVCNDLISFLTPSLCIILDRENFSPFLREFFSGEIFLPNLISLKCQWPTDVGRESSIKL